MFFACYLSTLIYTFHVTCRANMRHKCKFCESIYGLFSNIYGEYVWLFTRLGNMKTRLTWLQEKKLQNHLGGKQFSLLFKASVHGFHNSVLCSRCFCQGPTLMLIYSSDHVFGLYMPQNDKNKATDSCLLLAFEETEILGCEIGPCDLTDITSFSNKGKFQINLFSKEVTMSSDTLKKLKLFQHQVISLEECEAFRCEGKLHNLRVLFCMLTLRKKMTFYLSLFLGNSDWNLATNQWLRHNHSPK